MMTWRQVVSALRGLNPVGGAPELRTRYNIRPGEREGVLVLRSREGQVHPDRLSWGFRPDANRRFAPINAKSETLFGKWPWRYAASNRRCLVPMDGFYEPKGPSGQRQRPQYYFHFADGRPFFVAGVWSARTEGEALDSFALVTTAPNAQVAQVHERMPAIVEEEAQALWLSDSADTQALRQVLGPWEGDPLVCWEVDRKPYNEADDERCIAPLTDRPAQDVPSGA